MAEPLGHPEERSSAAVPAVVGTDVRWFEQLFTANYDDLLRYAARRIGVEAAHDVVAEVFLTAWRRRADYERSTARLWLFGVAHGVLANAARTDARAQRLTAKVSSQVSDRTVDHADAVVDALHVRAAIAALPATEAEALRLTEWDGFDIAEAAVVAGCSRATFRVRLHRARRHAALRLGNDIAEPTGSMDRSRRDRAEGTQT